LAAFTLIGLIVVLAILALLLTIAIPRYFARSRSQGGDAQKQDLNIMRDAIDKFIATRGATPTRWTSW
jgi:general secretion pathway protein G